MRSRITPNKHLVQFKMQKTQFAHYFMTELRNMRQKDRLPTARAGGRSLYTDWIQSVYTFPEFRIHAAAVVVLGSQLPISRQKRSLFWVSGRIAARCCLHSVRNRRPADRLGLFLVAAASDRGELRTVSGLIVESFRRSSVCFVSSMRQNAARRCRRSDRCRCPQVCPLISGRS